MSGIEFEPWEPEESVGKLWHSYVSGLGAPAHHADAAATLEDVSGRLGVLFRGLGGARDVEVKAAPPQQQSNRLSWRRSLGHRAERLARPSFDGEALRLPERIAVFTEYEANVALYIWLAASAAFSRPAPAEADPLRADIRAVQQAQAMTRATLAECPGLRSTYAALVARTRALRPDHALPSTEAAMEAAIRNLLGGAPVQDPRALRIAAAVRGETSDLTEFTAPR
ncbi:MAG: nitric oxide reductase D protein, partial [Hyphomicrobium sp.]